MFFSGWPRASISSCRHVNGRKLGMAKKKRSEYSLTDLKSKRPQNSLLAGEEEEELNSFVRNTSLHSSEECKVEEVRSCISCWKMSRSGSV